MIMIIIIEGLKRGKPVQAGLLAGGPVCRHIIRPGKQYDYGDGDDDDDGGLYDNDDDDGGGGGDDNDDEYNQTTQSACP